MSSGPLGLRCEARESQPAWPYVKRCPEVAVTRLFVKPLQDALDLCQQHADQAEEANK